MCGLTGWARFTPSRTGGQHDRIRLEQMTSTLAARGPDAVGYYFSPDGQAALGHRRLAVIDIENGTQPMSADDIALAYTGELYNYRALRDELRCLGHHFSTRSDTEVVLHAYREWGTAMLARLLGMYAFAIWDGRLQRLVLVRDRLGVKPLYVADIPGGIAFGSEPKALFAHPDVHPVVTADGLRQAYSLLFNTGPTIYDQVREIEPGTALVIGRDARTTLRYWDLTLTDQHGDTTAAVAAVRSLLNDAVDSQLEADVPICSLLSGGLDSTMVTALAVQARQRAGHAPLRSFAVDYADQASKFTADVLRTGHDAPYARAAAESIGTEHRTIVFEPTDLLDRHARTAVVACRDSPIGVGDMDTSLYLLFGAIRQHATVALSGEAADEVFLGYPWFHHDRFIKAETFPWLLVTGDEAAMPLHPDLRAELRIAELRADTYSDALGRVPHHPDDSEIERRQRELQHMSLTRWLRQLLHRKDRLSMARGLEVRVPYCDHRLVEYLFSAPWPAKSFDGREKSLLRSASRDICPESVLNRPKSHYPTTHHPEYNAGLQALAIEAFGSYPQISQIADRRAIEPLLRRAPGALDWASRLQLERVVDLSLWLEAAQPEIRI